MKCVGQQKRITNLHSILNELPCVCIVQFQKLKRRVRGWKAYFSGDNSPCMLKALSSVPSSDKGGVGEESSLVISTLKPQGFFFLC